MILVTGLFVKSTRASRISSLIANFGSTSRQHYLNFEKIQRSLGKDGRVCKEHKRGFQHG